jgi:hypothetical protein
MFQMFSSYGSKYQNTKYPRHMSIIKTPKRPRQVSLINKIPDGVVE